VQEAWGKRIVTLAAVYAGEARDAETIMQPLREIGGVVIDFSNRMKYVTCNSYSTRSCRSGNIAVTGSVTI
jgi:hypothetical protein